MNFLYGLFLRGGLRVIDRPNTHLSWSIMSLNVRSALSRLKSGLRPMDIRNSEILSPSNAAASGS